MPALNTVALSCHPEVAVCVQVATPEQLINLRPTPACAAGFHGTWVTETQLQEQEQHTAAAS